MNIFSGDPGVVAPLGPEYALGAGVSWQVRAYYSAGSGAGDIVLGSLGANSIDNGSEADIVSAEPKLERRR